MPRFENVVAKCGQCAQELLMFARKCAASSPLWSLTTAVVLQAKNSTLILRAEIWISEAETQVVPVIPLPATIQTYIETGKILPFILMELAHRLQKEFKNRGLMSDVSYGPYFSQWKENIYIHIFFSFFLFFLRETIRCPGKQSKPASSTTIWLGDSSRVIPVLAVQLSQSSPISQMTHLEKYIPELVIHPLHLPNLPIWDHRCWLNRRRKWMGKGSKMKSINI